MKGKGVSSVALRPKSERRVWQRVLLDLEVDYGNKNHYLFASIRDISVAGIFIRTTTPEQPGTDLNLRFTPRGSSEPLELAGEVIWVNSVRPGDPNSLDPGMGIRFHECSKDDQRRLERLVTTLALLSDPEVVAPPQAPTTAN